MNQISPNQEQLIRELVQALLTPAQKGECRCHVLDPSKTRVLAWRSLKDPNTLILKIADQKFIGLIRSDKNGEQYWKFRDFYEVDVPMEPKPKEQPKTEPQVNLPSDIPEQSLELEEKERSPGSQESEQVQKFREKYGTAESPKSVN